MEGCCCDGCTLAAVPAALDTDSPMDEEEAVPSVLAPGLGRCPIAKSRIFFLPLFKNRDTGDMRRLLGDGRLQIRVRVDLSDICDDTTGIAQNPPRLDGCSVDIHLAAISACLWASMVSPGPRAPRLPLLDCRSIASEAQAACSNAGDATAAGGEAPSFGLRMVSMALRPSA